MTQDTIITLYIFRDILEATLANDKLKANGIDSFLEDETAAGLKPFDGVALKVFEKDKGKADEMIAEFKN
jgi:hypothetical protein